MTFFLAGPVYDRHYAHIRDLPHCKPYREFVERLWARFRPSGDGEQFRIDAKTQFHQRFWEMYLFCALQDQGFDVRKNDPPGPDFCLDVGGGKYWVEAIAPEPGDPKKSGVPLSGLQTADYVPEDRILLRYTGALKDKLEQWKTWQRKDKHGDGYIIAINAWNIPNADLGRPLPYFIHAYLAFGPPSVRIDKASLEISKPFFLHRDAIEKAKEPVPKPLLGEDYSPISGVIHSLASCKDYRMPLGKDFSVLHNPLASIRLPGALFDCCTRFRFRDGVLTRTEPAIVKAEI